MNDHEIIGLYWSRSESAIAATAEKYGNYCHAIAYNILHSSDDAEECANDTYLSAWNTIPPQRPNRLSIYLGKSRATSRLTVISAAPPKNAVMDRSRLRCPS